MDGKRLREALRVGTRVYGTCVISTSPHWPEALKACSLDFVFLDTEHIALSRAGLAWMCRAYKALNLAPVVRIPAPDPYQATMVLDGGAEGVLAPYVETPEQVRRLKGAARFRPLKGERLEEVLAGRAELGGELQTYLDERNASTVFMINIESVPAMEGLDELLEVGGVDAVVVGPHDLSCSLGIPEQYHHPRFEAAVRRIIETSRRHGVGVGVHAFWDSVEQQIEWAKLGANLVLHSADLLLFRKTLVAELSRIRLALGDQAGENGAGQAV
jgi:4-hydroxy-2-oxoheptanedioate aldolase